MSDGSALAESVSESTPETLRPHELRGIVLGVGYAAFAAAYAFLGVTPSNGSRIFLQFAPGIGAALWIQADAQQTKVGLVFDRTWFLYVSWPVSIAWYTIRTRGRQGWWFGVGLYSLALSGWLGSVFGDVLRALLR